jgi:hypothetical protein
MADGQDDASDDSTHQARHRRAQSKNHAITVGSGTDK